MNENEAKLQPSQQRRQTPRALLALAIIAATLLAYIPAMRAGWIWDDDVCIYQNPVLVSPHGLKDIWLNPASTLQYYPLVNTLFRIEHSLWGFNPAGYHIVNILLHALNAVLLWRLMRRLAIPGAWFAGMVFALHPVFVESVAWATELKNVLSGFFYLSSLRFAIEFHLGESTERRRMLLYAGALSLFICAMLSKTVTCSLPVAVLLIVWWKNGTFSRRDLVALIPFFLIGAVLGLNTAMMERVHVGAVGSEWSHSFVERGLIAGRAIWFYLQKLLRPEPLIFIYPRWIMDGRVWWQYLFPLATLSSLIILWLMRQRIGRGPLAAALFFILTLFPALGFFNVYPMRYSYVADHFQYLAATGIIALAVGSLTRLLVPHRSVALCVGACALIIYATLTWQQCHAYQNEETLWRDTLDKNPSAWMAWNNLAVLLTKKGNALSDREESRALFDTAVDCCDRAIALKENYAEGWFNRGNANLGAIRFAEAARDYTQALAIKPNYVKAWYNRGNAYARMKQEALAIADYSRAIALAPDLLHAYFNRATCYDALSQDALAVADYSRVIELSPNAAPAYRNRAQIYSRTGQHQKAIEDMRAYHRLTEKRDSGFPSN